MKEIIVKNWKEYVLEGNDIVKLENDLIKTAWVDLDDGLVLADDEEDYRGDFWDRYSFVFDDRLLKDFYND